MYSTNFVYTYSRFSQTNEGCIYKQRTQVETERVHAKFREGLEAGTVTKGDYDKATVELSENFEVKGIAKHDLYLNKYGYHALVPMDTLHTVPQGLIKLLKQIFLHYAGTNLVLMFPNLFVYYISTNF